MNDSQNNIQGKSFMQILLFIHFSKIVPSNIVYGIVRMKITMCVEIQEFTLTLKIFRQINYQRKR